jgi:amphi-Trp domain-containing protein
MAADGQRRPSVADRSSGVWPAQATVLNGRQLNQDQIAGRLVVSTDRNLAGPSVPIRSRAIGSLLAVEGDVLRTLRPSHSVTPLEGTETAVSDLKVEQKQTLSREDAARLIRSLAEGMGADGKVTVQMGSTTLELSVAAHVDCELEVAVNGDEIELELELKWSTSGRAAARAADEESDEGESEVDDDEVDDDEADEAPEGEAAELEADQVELQAEPDEPDAGEPTRGEDGPAAGRAQDRRVPAGRNPRPRRARGNPSAATGRSASNGVDTAAVRAWAAANGLSVSPRGRIRDEVLQAYREAGN